jgi:hypothetical protein
MYGIKNKAGKSKRVLIIRGGEKNE